MAAGMSGSGILAITLPHLPSLLWLAFFYTLSGITWAVSEPAEASLVADLTGGSRFGSGYGFGSSDCRCPSHLVYLPWKPEIDNFIDLLSQAGYQSTRIQCWLPRSFRDS